MQFFEKNTFNLSKESKLKKSYFLKYFWIICWGAFFIFALFHFIVIYQKSVNIPIMDEWNDLFSDYGIILGWSKSFLLGFHSEHRIITTKILYLVNLFLFKLNFRYQILFNALVYAGIVLTIWKIIGSKICTSPYLPALIMMTPFISTLPHENHSWAFQSQFHFCLLSFIGGAYFIFVKKSWVYPIIGSFLWLVCIFSFSSGVLAVAVTTLFFALWNLSRKDKLSILKVVLVITISSLGVYLWSQGYQKNTGHPPYTMPWNLKYYQYLGEIISNGFGFTKVNSLSAILCLATVLMSIFSGLFAVFKYKLNKPQIGLLFGLTAGILAMLGIITFGRAGFPLYQAKASRYTEFGMLLPILSLGLITINKNVRFLGTLWISGLLIFGLFNDFGFDVYTKTMRRNQEGVQCIKSLLFYPQKNPGGVCPILFPFDLRPYLNNAKQLEASFYPYPAQIKKKE